MWKTVIALLVGLLVGAAEAAEPVSFRSQVAPILQEHCVACHNAKKAEGGYRLDTYQEMLVAGDSGEPPVSLPEGDVHELLRRLTSDDEFERMPAESEPLTAEQIALVSEWISAGAAFDGEDPQQPLSFVIPAPQHIDPPASYAATVPITALAFSPDGTQVLASGYHEITVWDLEGTLVRRIKNIGQRVFAMAFSADGATLAVACGEPGRSGEVRLVDFASGEVQAVTARSTDVALDVAFRPGTDELAVASADSHIRVINYKTLAEVRTLASHADWVTAVAWSDDGSHLVSGSRDKSTKVFAADSGQLLISYQGHGAAVRGVTFSPDAAQVLSSGADHKLHRWNVADAKKIAEVALGGEGFAAVRSEGFVLVPSADRRLLKIDLASNQLAQAFQGHQDWVLSTAHHAATQRIASGSFDGEIRLWDAAAGSELKHWTAKP